ncbi:PKD domain-containing protein [Candidatus Bipolaricaulota bacterium]|nr:PKD domain-containing protein [Candidatus Bipolaricaulota bacterium]
MRRVLGILLLILCVSVATQGRSYTLVQSENNVGFFTNETGVEATALVIVFSGNVEILNVLGFGAEMEVTSSQGPTVVLHGAVPPSGVVIVEWALDGPGVGAAVWSSEGSAKHSIDVKSPTAHMVIIPPPVIRTAPINFVPQFLPADFGMVLANGYFVVEHQFLSVGSSDPDGVITEYLWEWSDGVTTYGASASRVFEPLQFKTYSVTVTLTVTDDSGRTDSTSRTFEIEQAWRPAQS